MGWKMVKLDGQSNQNQVQFFGFFFLRGPEDSAMPWYRYDGLGVACFASENTYDFITDTSSTLSECLTSSVKNPVTTPSKCRPSTNMGFRYFWCVPRRRRFLDNYVDGFLTKAAMVVLYRSCIRVEL